MTTSPNNCRCRGAVRRALLAVTLLVAPGLPGAARAANFWMDFNHDNSLGTIQPNSSLEEDTLSIVIDFSGLNPTAPFTVTWQSVQLVTCFPNQTEGAVAGIDTLPGSLTADADSVWFQLSTDGAGNQAIYNYGARFKRAPTASPQALLKLVLTYPAPEFTPCPNAGQVCFTPGFVNGSLQAGVGRCVRIKDHDVPVAPMTWGHLRRAYL